MLDNEYEISMAHSSCSEDTLEAMREADLQEISDNEAAGKPWEFHRSTAGGQRHWLLRKDEEGKTQAEAGQGTKNEKKLQNANGLLDSKMTQSSIMKGQWLELLEPQPVFSNLTATGVSEDGNCQP